jgi:chromosome segregation ATPase
MSFFRAPGESATLIAAARYIESLEGLVAQRDEEASAAARRIADLEAKLREERRHRTEAEDELAEIEEQFGGSEPERAAFEQRIVELEERIAELELDKRVAERKIERLTEEMEEHNALGDDAAVRRRVLRQQAVRARLAKTDMSVWARLQTLKQAERLGVDLDDDQVEELDELRERYE